MSAPPSSASSPSLRALFSSRAGHLALAVLVVELLAGMQIYLNQTVLPLLATEMGARNAYGLVTAAAQVPPSSRCRWAGPCSPGGGRTAS